MFGFYIIFQNWILLRRYERFLIGRISTKKKRRKNIVEIVTIVID